MPQIKISVGGGKLFDSVIMAADLTSDWVDLGAANELGVHVWTVQGAGAPDHIGVIELQQTNDVNQTPVAHATTITIATGAAENQFLNFSDINSRYVRLFYDRTSGGDDDELSLTLNVKRQT